MAVEFTTEELRGILLAAGLSSADALALAATIGGLSVTTDLEEFLAKQLTGKVPKEMLDVALAQANREAKRITGNLLQAELNSIAKSLEANIAAGLSPVELARKLEEIKGLDSNRASAYENYRALLEASDLTDAEIEAKLERLYEKLLRDRKKTIARTEQRFATSEANMLESQARGQQFKVWQTVGDSDVSDICAGNEGDGWIGIDEAFASGDQRPPAHPNCRCTLSYRTTEPDSYAKDRADKRAERTQAARA